KERSSEFSITHVPKTSFINFPQVFKTFNLNVQNQIFMKHTIILYFLLFVTFANGQSINANWQQDLNLATEELKKCENTNPSGVSSCNHYMGNALKQIYKIDDFYSARDERNMLAHEIAEFLKNSEKWTLLGYGFE